MEPDFVDDKSQEKKRQDSSKSLRFFNTIFNKKIKLLLACLIFLFVLIKASTLIPAVSSLISNSNLTASVISSSDIEDLGVQFQSLVVEGIVMFRDTNGDPHWLGLYNKITDGSGRAQFFDVNMGTGVTRYFNTFYSGRGTGTKALSGNKLYISVADPCSLWEYNITTGTFTERTAAGWISGFCGISRDIIAYSSYTAADGMIYFGTTTRGTMFEVDPSTGVIRDFGIIDAPSGDPTCSGCSLRYVVNITADATYVYGLMRDVGTNSYWLVIVNRSNGSLSASCFKNDLLNSGGVSTSTDGTQIWYSNNSGSYRIDNTGGTCPSVIGTPPTLKTWFYPSNVYSPSGDSYAQAASVFGVDIDDSDVTPDTSTGGLTTLRYRNPAGSGSYTTKTQSIVMMNALIRRIKAKDNTSAYLGQGSYGSNALFNGSSSSVVGRIRSQSLYAITPLGSYVYLSGYASTTYRWTPTLPWTLTAYNGTSCSVESSTNPCSAFQGMGKYHYYGAVATDGLLYIASSYDRGSRAGGDIGWINSSTGSTGSYTFTCDSPKGFALLSNGTTVAYSSESENGNFGCTNTEGKLFLFNTMTHSTSATLTPVSGADNQGKIVGTNDAGILGIIKDFPTSGNYTLYKVDTSGNHASWSPINVNGNIFGNSSKGDQHLIRARDGMIYTWDSTGIIRINSTDGSRTAYATISGVTYLELVGEDLYIAAGSSLKRIRAVDPISALSSTRAINSFNFNALNPAVTGTVNETNKTISLTVPFGTNVTVLTPTIVINGASISPTTGIAQNFTNPVTYTVAADDSSTQNYVVNVTVATDTTGGSGSSSSTTSSTTTGGSGSSSSSTTGGSGSSSSSTTGGSGSSSTTTTTTGGSGSSSSRAITAFNFSVLNPYVTGTVNETNKTISLTVPFGTNVTVLTPTIVINGASISPTTGIAQNFTNPVTYTVAADDSSTQNYVVNVTVLPENTASSYPSNRSITAFKLFTGYLRFGKSGDKVKELQVFLNDRGFIVSQKGVGSIGNETKFFGLLTKQAVIKFQKTNNLQTDGIIGPITHEKIKVLSQ